MLYYFLWANVYALLFFALYYIFIRNLKSHSWSRFYLVVSILLSLVLPGIKLNVSGFMFHKVVQPVQTVLLPEFVLRDTPSSFFNAIQYLNSLQILYALIGTFLLIQFVYRMIALKLFLSKQLLSKENGYKLGLNTGAGPASFGSTIIFPDSHVDHNILQHELAHLKLKHHFDKVGLQCIRCFAFPVLAFHFMYHELLIVHEFEADEMADIDKETYTQTLLTEHLGGQQISLLQNFFHHPLKRRIMMLYKNKTSNKGRKTLLLAASAIALSGMLLLQSNTNAVAQSKKSNPADKVFISVEQEPEFPGGPEAMHKYLAEHIKYPKEARKANVYGKVIVQFVVDVDGSVTEVATKRDIGYGCGAEAVRVVSSMPKWTPGKQKGVTVKTLYIIPINFAMKS